MESLVNSCLLLLRISGKSDIKGSIEVDNSEKGVLNRIKETYGEVLKFGRCNINKLLKKKNNFEPLVYQDISKEYGLLVRLSENEALVQKPHSPTPDIISIDELKQSWTGRIVYLKKSYRFNLRWFLDEFAKYKKLIYEVLLFSFLLQLLALVTPIFFQIVMDKVLVHQSISTLDVIVTVLILTGIVEVILRGLREYLFTHTANRIDLRLGLKVFIHLLGLPLLYFKQRQVGAIITRVQELSSIRDFLTGSMITLCVDLVFTAVFFAVMYTLSKTLTLLVLATVPLYLLLAKVSSTALKERIEQQFQAGAINTSFLSESLTGIETIKSLAIEPRMTRRWESQTCDLVSSGFNTQTLSSLINHGVMGLQKVTSVLVIWFGAGMVISLDMTIGQLIAFNMMASHVSQPLAKLVDLWTQYIQTRVAVDKLSEMIDLPTEQSSNANVEAKDLKGRLVIKDLSFRYQPDSPMVLHHIDLTIPAGQSIGIVGPSGSGKSTLTKLIQKLYYPDEGEIFIDDVALRDIDPISLRSHIGIVLQENYLFHNTIRENIALKDPSVSFDEVVHAATLAGAHDFILQLPLGYDTKLSEGGSSLSGGQKQRIAIARALIGEPKILIFDEATSALDDESQSIILNNMEQIAHGRTVITIAHRLSTIKHCDRIIALEGGEIIESGNHRELLKLDGCYARLWKLQQNLQQE